MKKQQQLAASAVRLRNTLTTSQVDTGLFIRSAVVGAASTQTLLDLCSHGQKRLLDIGGLLGGSLDERNAHRVGELLSNSGVDNLLVGHITLVTDQELVDTLGGISVNFLEPLLDVVKTLLLCSIVNNNDAMGTTVVRGSDGSKSLLTSSVPLVEYAGKKRLWLVLAVFAHWQSQILLTIWSFTVLPSRSIVRILKSTPIVEM
jgi:hypothetical protein